MPRLLSQIALLVHDYDEAIRWYTDVLGFVLLEDTPLDGGKRWVRIAPGTAAETALLLARAASPEQSARVGDQAGGRVFLFLDTDDFERDYARLAAHGVHFLRGPVTEPYGTVAVFTDPYGNKWDLVERRTARCAR